MFESVKNDRIIADLKKLADQINELNRDCAAANSTTVGKFTTSLREQLGKVRDHVSDMVKAAVRSDEIKGDDASTEV